MAGQRVEETQDGGRVAAATAETGARRNALAEVDPNPGREPDPLDVEERRSGSQIVRSSGCRRHGGAAERHIVCCLSPEAYLHLIEQAMGAMTESSRW